MKIIRNYFLKEFISNFFASFIGITFILLLGNLIKALDFIVRKGVDVTVAGKSFLYAIPYLLQYSLPLASLLGILICMGRFASDNEFIALKVAGIGMFKLLKFFLTFGAALSIFLIFLHSHLIPHSHYMSKVTIKEIAKSNPLGLIEPGVFIDSFKGYVLLTQDMESNILKKVYIYQAEGDKTNVIFANRGEFVVDDNILKVKLQDGFIEGPNMQYRNNFESLFMNLPFEKNKIHINKKPKHMGIKEILRQIKLTINSKEEHIREMHKELLVEINRKISLSFASFIFILLGFGVSGQVKVREKSMNYSVIFIAGLGYYLLSLLCTSLVMKNLFPVVGIWLPNLVFFLIGIYYSYKTCKS